MGLLDMCPWPTSGALHVVPEPLLPRSAGDVMVAASSRGLHGGLVSIFTTGVHLCPREDVANHGLFVLNPVYLVVGGLHGHHSPGGHAAVCSALGPLRVFCQLSLPLPVPFEQARGSARLGPRHRCVLALHQPHTACPQGAPKSTVGQHVQCALCCSS